MSGNNDHDHNNYGNCLADEYNGIREKNKNNGNDSLLPFIARHIIKSTGIVWCVSTTLLYFTILFCAFSLNKFVTRRDN